MQEQRRGMKRHCSSDGVSDQGGVGECDPSAPRKWGDGDGESDAFLNTAFSVVPFVVHIPDDDRCMEIAGVKVNGEGGTGPRDMTVWVTPRRRWGVTGAELAQLHVREGVVVDDDTLLVPYMALP